MSCSSLLETFLEDFLLLVERLVWRLRIEACLGSLLMALRDSEI